MASRPTFSPMKIVCPTCRERGLRSKVYVGMSSRTLMAVLEWYDEDGNHHFSDSNKTTTNYSCSNGHQWSERR